MHKKTNFNPLMPMVPKRDTYFDGKSWNNLRTNGIQFMPMVPKKGHLSWKNLGTNGLKISLNLLIFFGISKW